MIRIMYFGLSFIFGIVTLASVIQFNDLAFVEAFFRLAMFAGFTCACIYLAIESGKKPQEQNAYKVEIEDLPPITDEQLEIERAKIKANKLKKIHSDKDIFGLVICLFIPIFGWGYVAFRVHRYLMKERYFMSKEFIQHKMQN